MSKSLTMFQILVLAVIASEDENVMQAVTLWFLVRSNAFSIISQHEIN